MTGRLRSMNGLVALAAVAFACAVAASRPLQPSSAGVGSADDGPAAGGDCAAGRACLHGEGGVCALFAPGTPWEVVRRVADSINPETPGPGQRYALNGTAWFGGTGSGGTLRYSFPPDGLHIAPGFTGDISGPNVLHARMNTLFADEGGAPFWKQLFRDTFDRWGEINGVTYVEVSDDGATWGLSGSANRGDVRIVMRDIDGVSGILAFNFYPLVGDMVLDTAENWAAPANDYRYLRNTISHEHGHGLGLQHVCPINITKLMEPFLNLNFDGPQHDDIRGAQALYGDRFEPNSNLGSAAPLGLVAQGESLVVEELSLRNSSDADYFSFNAVANSRVTVSVQPIGETYSQGAMGASPTCGPGAPFNSLSIANATVTLYNQAQNQIGFSNSAGAGSPETLVGVPLPGAGTYYIRVGSSAMTGISQAYELKIDVARISTAPCPSDIDGNGVVNAFDLAIILSQWGLFGGPADVNDDGVVNAIDLGQMLGAWGLCP